ncbi:unnamed protein product, partial [Cylicostephanus goldi]
MTRVLQEHADNWDTFLRLRDEADMELGNLRGPLEDVSQKPRRSTNDAQQDFEALSAQREKTSILTDKIRQLQQICELLDPLESPRADIRFIDVDTEQLEKQYDDVLSDLSSEIEEENLLCDSMDHFNNEINSISDQLSKEPTRENLENIEKFQVPALRAQLAMLKEKQDEAKNSRKHVDTDSSRLAALEDRMKNLDSMLEDAKKAAERDE